MAPRPLSLPLEVIERILKLAFLPNALPSDPESTETTPPSSTSHLLLISKAIRQICLPFFWRSITIAKPQDWIALFDPKEGLVVVGEEGRKRWELVEELRIVVEAVVPVSMELSSDNYLVQLALPRFRRVPKVVLEHLPLISSDSEPPSWIAKEEERETFRFHFLAFEEDLSSWNHPMGSLVDESAEDRARRVMRNLEDDFRLDLGLDRCFFMSTVFNSFQPRHTVLTVEQLYDHLSTLVLDEAIAPFSFSCYLEFTKDRSSLHGGESDDPIYTANEIFRVDGGFSASLVGYSSDYLRAVEAWVVEEAISYAKAERWNSKWTWKREDGSTFFIDFSKCWS